MQRMMRATGARLAKPALTAVFVHWRGDWEEGRRAEAEERMKTAKAKARRKSILAAEKFKAEKEARAEEERARKEERQALEVEIHHLNMLIYTYKHSRQFVWEHRKDNIADPRNSAWQVTFCRTNLR